RVLFRSRMTLPPAMVTVSSPAPASIHTVFCTVGPTEMWSLPQRVDQDDVETALLRNQPLQGRPLVQSQRLGREIRRLGADVGLQRIGILLASPLPQLVEADLHVGAAEQWLAGGIGGAEVEVYAGGETEYAVVVGQASDEMVVAQQSWLVDEIHRDDIVTLGAC